MNTDTNLSEVPYTYLLCSPWYFDKGASRYARESGRIHQEAVPLQLAFWYWDILWSNQFNKGRGAESKFTIKGE